MSASPASTRSRALRLGIAAGLAAALLAMALWWPAPPDDGVIEEGGRLKATRLYMGGIPGTFSCVGLPRAGFVEALGRADAVVRGLEARLSSWQPQSAVSRLNAAPAGRYPADPLLLAVLRVAADVSRASRGAFDVTVGPLLDLWHQAERQGQPPDGDAVARARRHVGWQLVRAEEESIWKRDGLAHVDLGGVAKGTLADAGRDALVAAGCQRVVVELGGDLSLHRGADQPPFRIGVTDPFGPEGLAAVLAVEARAVVTSGDYERFFEVGGQRYSHIVDPRTGLPIPPGIASATVTAPDASQADAWATALLVLGWDDAIAAVRDTPGLEALLIGRDRRTWVSPGLQGKVTWRGEWGK